MEELLASIVKLQGDDVVRALQGMLQQAKIALKPANKSSKTKPSHTTTSPPAATTDKRALACGIVALLQHSCTPAAAAVSSTTDLVTSISEALVDGMRQQPWLWERLIRQHLDYLLQMPEAVDILTTSLHQLDVHVVCRNWAVLSSQLRHVDPVVLCSAPALGNFQRAALNQVSSCFRLISRDVLPSGQIKNNIGGSGGGAGGNSGSNSGVNNTNTSEVHITLSLQLPAALYTLLYLVGVTDQQGVVSLYSDQVCVEGATAYTSMLLTGMSTPETVYKILQLENLHKQKKSKTTKTAKKSSDGGSKNKKSSSSGKKEKAVAAVGNLDDGKGDQEDTMEEEEPKLSMENISKIYATMTTLTVLIEALLTSPQLSQEAIPTTETSHHHQQQQQQLLPRIAVFLSIRWELAQLLAAAGITPGSSLAKSFIKNAPPLWSLQTCAAILDAAVVCSPVNGGLRPGQQQQLEQSGGTPALTMPPAMLSHALELIQDALLSNKVSYTEEASLEFFSLLVHRVMQVQEACATGVLTPHAAVHAGPGHHIALTAARKLHSLLLAEENMDATAAVEKKNQGSQGGSKRSGHAVPAASKKRKKGVSDKGDNGQDAVANLMRMFTSEPLEPPVGAPASTAAATTAAAVAGSKKEGRRRITPQAIENPTVVLNNPSFTNSLPPGTNNNIKEDGNADEEDDDTGDEIEDDAAPAPAVNGGRGTFGRVVMASTLDMDDATREAAWQAYIADKEQLVEMLGDSAYHEWYDEAEHPLSSRMTGNTGANSQNIDTFFDAIFGGAGEGRKNASLGGGSGGGILFGSVLPQNVLETSLLYPWQAALAASLHLALSILKSIANTSTTATSTTATTAAAVCCQNLVSLEHRKASAAAVLKIVDPTHSRNTWLAASKGAELYPASGSLLHLVHQLRVLLLRTSRRTSPPMLAGYLALARFILETAAEQEAENVSTAAAAGEMATPASAPAAAAASSKAPWIPLRYVGHILQSFCCYPPLLAGSFNAISAEALPRVASAGMASTSDRTAHTAGLLWLIVQSNSRISIRPEWLNTAIPEARSHPFVAAAPLVQSAAAAELLCQLAEEGAVLTVAVLDNGTIEVPVFTCLMPLIDACAATAFYLHYELEQQDAGHEVPSAAVLLGHSGSMASLDSLSSILLNCFANSAQELASTLDILATSTASEAADSTVKLVEIEQRASFLGIGLEFIEIVSLVAPFLNQAEITASGGQLPLSDALNSCMGAQGSCLELLRTLSEDSEAYLAAVRGLENAPVLALPPSASNDDEEEHDALDGEELDVEENDNVSDRVELSAYERRKRLKDIRNPYLRVIVAESRQAAGDAADGELSDLEDFIVANPERDYGGFIADHFPMAEESGGEEEDSEEEEEEEQIDGAGGQSGGD